eukprot:TRINITY_DN6431_c0_g3_i5.p2 TRINITY_DN6431_c0_g3~~TRINITY_DN6431_c0_g3_i5.p2  ORF type:complete len:134 (+),score=7.98 TRINITY_DN6431_c0_g3_i5:1059-1460(+)
MKTLHLFTLFLGFVTSIWKEGLFGGLIDKNARSTCAILKLFHSSSTFLVDLKCNLTFSWMFCFIHALVIKIVNFVKLLLEVFECWGIYTVQCLYVLLVEDEVMVGVHLGLHGDFPRREGCSVFEKKKDSRTLR